MFCPTVHIVGEAPNKSHLEAIPAIISLNSTFQVEPLIHVEEELFSITLSSSTEMDSYPLLVHIQGLITKYLDWQEINYIVHVDGMT